MALIRCYLHIIILAGAHWALIPYSRYISHTLSAGDGCLLICWCHHKQPVTVTLTLSGTLLDWLCVIATLGLLKYRCSMHVSWRGETTQTFRPVFAFQTQAPSVAGQDFMMFASCESDKKSLGFVPPEPKLRFSPSLANKGLVYWPAPMTHACKMSPFAWLFFRSILISHLDHTQSNSLFLGCRGESQAHAAKGAKVRIGIKCGRT